VSDPAKLRVLVTGVGGRSVGYQILHALRCAEPRYEIVVTDFNPYSFGLYESDKRYLLPFPRTPEYLPELMQLIRRDGIDVVLPGTEEEVVTLAGVRDQISSLNATLIAADVDAIRLCQDKEQLHRRLSQLGVAVPRTVPAREWRTLGDRFPFVGKPSKMSGGSRGVRLLTTEAEVEDYIRTYPSGSDDLLIQEYVGSPDSEYTVGVLIGPQGRLIDAIVIQRKLIGLSLLEERWIDGKRYAISSGYSQGYVVRNENLSRACSKLALDLGLRGPVNIQCRLDGDRFAPFEVHPRFSGTTSIRADVGFNEPDIMIRTFVLGEDIRSVDHRTDVAVIRAFRTKVVPIDELQAVRHPHG
jgi:carbamoyl-phosphate synthase large subunit